jgi:hypothetical protein
MVVKEYKEPPNGGMYGAKPAKQDGGGRENKGNDDSSGDEVEGGDGVDNEDEQKIDAYPGTTAETSLLAELETANAVLVRQLAEAKAEVRALRAPVEADETHKDRVIDELRRELEQARAESAGGENVALNGNGGTPPTPTPNDGEQKADAAVAVAGEQTDNGLLIQTKVRCRCTTRPLTHTHTHTHTHTDCVILLRHTNRPATL